MTGNIFYCINLWFLYVLYKLLENYSKIIFAAQQKIRAPQCWGTKFSEVYLIIHDGIIVIQNVNSSSAFWKKDGECFDGKMWRTVQMSPVHPVCFRCSGGTTKISKFFVCFTLTLYTNLVCVTAVRKLMSKMVPLKHGYLSDKLHGITPPGERNLQHLITSYKICCEF